MEKKCKLCNSSERDELRLGEFVSKKNVGVHTFCLYLTSALAQRGKANEGIIGFLLSDIENEARRIVPLKCCYCRKGTAGIGCCAPKCHRSFHLLCGIENGAKNQYVDSYSSFCDKHVTPVKYRPAKDQICCICLEELVGPNGTFQQCNMLRAPCCQNGWFHKICLQRTAFAAGYFFKCPLCNDSSKFRQELPYQGISIPDRDAEWELEENAFQELLERPNACAAEKCRCRNGRQAKQDANPFVYCNMCGSVAIHKQCLSNKTTFQCVDCRQFMGEAKTPITQENVTDDVDIMQFTEDDEEDAGQAKTCNSKTKIYHLPMTTRKKLTIPAKTMLKSTQTRSTTEVENPTLDVPLTRSRTKSTNTRPNMQVETLVAKSKSKVETTDLQPPSTRSKSTAEAKNRSLEVASRRSKSRHTRPTAELETPSFETASTTSKLASARSTIEVETPGFDVPSKRSKSINTNLRTRSKSTATRPRTEVEIPSLQVSSTRLQSRSKSTCTRPKPQVAPSPRSLLNSKVETRSMKKKASISSNVSTSHKRSIRTRSCKTQSPASQASAIKQNTTEKHQGSRNKASSSRPCRYARYARFPDSSENSSDDDMTSSFNPRLSQFKTIPSCAPRNRTLFRSSGSSSDDDIGLKTLPGDSKKSYADNEADEELHPGMPIDIIELSSSNCSDASDDYNYENNAAANDCVFNNAMDPLEDIHAYRRKVHEVLGNLEKRGRTVPTSNILLESSNEYMEDVGTALDVCAEQLTANTRTSISQEFNNEHDDERTRESLCVNHTNRLQRDFSSKERGLESPAILNSISRRPSESQTETATETASTNGRNTLDDKTIEVLSDTDCESAPTRLCIWSKYISYPANNVTANVHCFCKSICENEEFNASNVFKHSTTSLDRRELLCSLLETSVKIFKSNDTQITSQTMVISSDSSSIEFMPVTDTSRDRNTRTEQVSMDICSDEERSMQIMENNRRVLQMRSLHSNNSCKKSVTTDELIPIQTAKTSQLDQISSDSCSDEGTNTQMIENSQRASPRLNSSRQVSNGVSPSVRQSFATQRTRNKKGNYLAKAASKDMVIGVATKGLENLEKVNQNNETEQCNSELEVENRKDKTSERSATKSIELPLKTVKKVTSEQKPKMGTKKKCLISQEIHNVNADIHNGAADIHNVQSTVHSKSMENPVIDTAVSEREQDYRTTLRDFILNNGKQVSVLEESIAANSKECMESNNLVYGTSAEKSNQAPGQNLQKRISTETLIPLEMRKIRLTNTFVERDITATHPYPVSIISVDNTYGASKLSQDVPQLPATIRTVEALQHNQEPPVLQDKSKILKSSTPDEITKQLKQSMLKAKQSLQQRLPSKDIFPMALTKSKLSIGAETTKNSFTVGQTNEAHFHFRPAPTTNSTNQSFQSSATNLTSLAEFESPSEGGNKTVNNNGTAQRSTFKCNPAQAAHSPVLLVPRKTAKYVPQDINSKLVSLEKNKNVHGKPEAFKILDTSFIEYNTTTNAENTTSSKSVKKSLFSKKKTSITKTPKLKTTSKSKIPKKITTSPRLSIRAPAAPRTATSIFSNKTTAKTAMTTSTTSTISLATDVIETSSLTPATYCSKIFTTTSTKALTTVSSITTVAPFAIISTTPSTSISATPFTITSATPTTITSATKSTITSATPSNITSATPSNITSATKSTITSATPSTITSATLSTITSATPSAITSATPTIQITTVQSTITSATISTITSATPSTITSATPSTITSATPSNITSATPSNITSATPSNITSATKSTITSATSSAITSATPSAITSATPTIQITTVQSIITSATPSIITSATPSIITSATPSTQTSATPSTQTTSTFNSELKNLAYDNFISVALSRTSTDSAKSSTAVAKTSTTSSITQTTSSISSTHSITITTETSTPSTTELPSTHESTALHNLKRPLFLTSSDAKPSGSNQKRGRLLFGFKSSSTACEGPSISPNAVAAKYAEKMPQQTLLPPAFIRTNTTRHNNKCLRILNRR